MMSWNESAPARILVVDDDAAIRELLREILADAGYLVLEARNGREAMVRCREDQVNLMITDLVMPEQEGIETIRLIRREFPAVKVIAISGAFGGEYLRVAELLGAHGTLQKPLSVDGVLQAVQQTLGDLTA